MTVARQHIHIGGSQRPDQEFVADGAAIDEQELRHSRAARIGRQACVSGQANALTLRINGQRVFGELPAEDRGEPPAQGVEQIAGFGVRAERDALTVCDIFQREANGGLCHGQPFDHIVDRLHLRAVRA